jgi:hypothetical protein
MYKIKNTSLHALKSVMREAGKGILKMTKVLILLLVCGLFYSCAENPQNQNTVNRDDAEKTAMNKIMAISATPDSLRSPEDKLLMQQLEALMFESCQLENGKINVIINKEEVIRKGIPEIYYDILKKDVNDLNAFLDTTSFPKQIIEDGFLESQREYFARKEIQHAD